ncbi:type II secretion system protein [Proteiniborus sp. DW1]|uniref:type IV pilus modification PilV family protein n=1 Tax=Proteiniborus sp. DW1 TaxID=1889883 RepID=UPI000945BF52|nr:type II secretion system protein [Proteiniborus sp. DW1]
MIRKLRSCSGLSLIELLFTISILGIVMISIAPLMINSNKINRKSESLYNATLLAQGYMESIKASDCITVGRTVEIHDNTQVIIDIEKVVKYDHFYKVTIEVLQDHELIERFEGYKIIMR